MNRNKTEYREEYRAELAKVWKKSVKMVDFCEKEADEIVKIAGYLVPLVKPRIETSFCFGYGFCGMSTEEEQRDANRQAENARTARYFKGENLREIDKKIKELEEGDKTPVLVEHYFAERGVKIGEVHLLRFWEEQEQRERAERNGYFFHRLTAEEVAAYVDALKERRERFNKRLDAYWKRYGSTKLKTWSYLSD